MSPKLWLLSFCSGTPETVLGDLPLTVEFGVYRPLSMAAVAVTTLKVEPGGQAAWVELLNSRLARPELGGVVGVVGRVGVHGQDRPRPRIERDHRAGPPGQPLHGHPLGLGIERRVDVVADRARAELAEDRAEPGLHPAQFAARGTPRVRPAGPAWRSNSRPPGRTGRGSDRSGSRCAGGPAPNGPARSCRRRPGCARA